VLRQVELAARLDLQKILGPWPSDRGYRRCGAFKLVHDTFHHHLAGEPALFAEMTGLVHISGVTDEDVRIADMRDLHRVLVDGEDRLDNVGQIRALRSAGCAGPLSFEPFSPAVHELNDPARALADSIAFIRTRL